MNSKETGFSVQGMKCGGCVTRARDAVSKLPGYEGADFDLKAGTAVVKGEVDPEAVVHVLTKLGYPASQRASIPHGV